MVIDRNVAMGFSQPQSRESKFREEMAKRVVEYTTTLKYTIFCGTWNVNCIAPQELFLNEWLAVCNEPPDIYAIAFQEIDMKPDTILFSETRPDVVWVEKINEGLSPGAKYTDVATVRCVHKLFLPYSRQIFIFCFHL